MDTEFEIQITKRQLKTIAKALAEEIKTDMTKHPKAYEGIVNQKLGRRG